uniref:Uncharacterized protein n=1 Tax=Vespula pensylvanica TaxID=30213 RepID=A0A834P4I7_VESPE|nr:hypothetical protein H0235_007251 [Vespula pensylvanica]
MNWIHEEIRKLTLTSSFEYFKVQKYTRDTVGYGLLAGHAPAFIRTAKESTEVAAAAVCLRNPPLLSSTVNCRLGREVK